MPSGDRTGPMGQGSMTGRGFGFCSENDIPVLKMVLADMEEEEEALDLAEE